MTRPQQRLLAQLASSPNELASGLGQCLEALRLISALPRTSPVFVQYASGTVKAFGRDHLSRVPLRTVISLIKTSLGLSDPIHVTSALFYREDGSIDVTPVLIDEDSWKELAPYVHTLHVEDSVDSPVVSVQSTTSTVVGNGSAPSPVTGAGAGSGRASALNLGAPSFVPSANGITIKTSDGSKLNLHELRKSSFSPPSPQPTSPFAMLDNTDTCN